MSAKVAVSPKNNFPTLRRTLIVCRFPAEHTAWSLDTRSCALDQRPTGGKPRTTAAVHSMSLCRAFRLARRHASTSAWHTTPLEGRSVLRLEGADVFTFLQASAGSVAPPSWLSWPP